MTAMRTARQQFASAGEQIQLDLARNAVVEGAYRYWLHQRVGHGYGKGWVVFCMLNPSVADARRSDPTSRRCIDFARMWDREGVILVNLYAAISTDPDALYDTEDALGRRNMMFISIAARVVKKHGGEFVCAWGSHPLARLRVADTLDLVRAVGVETYCLGKTKSGMPRHPLWVTEAKGLEIYNAR